MTANRIRKTRRRYSIRFCCFRLRVFSETLVTALLPSFLSGHLFDKKSQRHYCNWLTLWVPLALRRRVSAVLPLILLAFGIIIYKYIIIVHKQNNTWLIKLQDFFSYFSCFFPQINEKYAVFRFPYDRFRKISPKNVEINLLTDSPSFLNYLRKPVLIHSFFSLILE